MSQRIVTWLGIAAAIMALAAMRDTSPSLALINGPIETTGAQGERVGNDAFTVDVKHVTLADALLVHSHGRTVERSTGGVWIEVRLEAEASRAPLSLTGLSLRTASGRSYSESGRVPSNPAQLSAKLLQPGLRQTGVSIFEVPRDETITDLVVSAAAFPSMQPQSAIHLDMQAAERVPRLEIGADGK